jgi:hypothetical protein
MPSVTAPPAILRTSGIDEALAGAGPHDDAVEAAALEQQDAVNLTNWRAEAVDDRRSGLEGQE